MNEIHEDLKGAIECSIYHSPREPGLTFQEMIEAGTQLGYQRGELGDAINMLSRTAAIAQGRIQLPPHAMLTDFLHKLEPDYRNYDAFEFVVQHLRDLVKAVGREQARIPRPTLIAQGVAKGVSETALEVAVTLYLVDGHLLQDKDGLLRFAPGREGYAPPTARRAARAPRARGRATAWEDEGLYFSALLADLWARDARGARSDVVRRA